MTKEHVKKYQFISAICFVAIAAIQLIMDLIRANDPETIFFHITFDNVLTYIIYAAIAVTLFIGKKPAVIGVIGLYAVVCLMGLLAGYDSIYNAVLLLAFAALITTLVLSLLGNPITEKIWFAAGALLALGTLIGWVDSHLFYYGISIATWETVLANLLEIAGFVMIGLWCKVDTCAAPRHKSAMSHVGTADKLKMYKDLLDSGVITQEEFDAKKREVLGL